VRRALLGVPIVIAFGLLAAACGSSSSSSSASAPSTGSAAATTPATTSNASSGTAVKLTTKHSKFGTILAAGPKQMTVYLFEGDKASKSSCDSACAKAWPPVTTSGNPGAGGTAVSADLGTTMRSNGTEQVTYKGHPLYYFIKDKDDGDAYGQNVHAFGNDWYVLAPSGNKVDNS
jgi:predicted lipoprotein with Yx(FWY)xxD motif